MESDTFWECGIVLEYFNAEIERKKWQIFDESMVLLYIKERREKFYQKKIEVYLNDRRVSVKNIPDKYHGFKWKKLSKFRS